MKHTSIEKNSILLVILTITVISIGGLIEIVPLFVLKNTTEKVDGMRPYTPLELAGFNIYIREGCYGCHSQQIRSLRSEVERYGHRSIAAESMYDYPFQWGSKRTGPDLARVGGKYSNEWHKEHLINPRSVVPKSIMPSYSFMAERPLNFDDISDNLKTLSIVGVPYTTKMIDNAKQDLLAQVDPDGDSDELQKRYNKVKIENFDKNPNIVSELDALIAYLQMLGTLVNFKN